MQFDLVSGKSTPIEVLAGANLIDLEWSADGRWIYAVADRAGHWHLWREVGNFALGE